MQVTNANCSHPDRHCWCDGESKCGAEAAWTVCWPFFLAFGPWPWSVVISVVLVLPRWLEHLPALRLRCRRVTISTAKSSAVEGIMSRLT